MVRTIIKKIAGHLIVMVDKVIEKLQYLQKRVEAMEKDVDEAITLYKNGNYKAVDKKRIALYRESMEGYKSSIEMIVDAKKIAAESTRLERHQKETERINSKVEGKTIKPRHLIEFIQFNKDDGAGINNAIKGKELFFKGHKLSLIGYKQEINMGGYTEGALLIHEIGEVKMHRLERALQEYIMGREGIEVDDVVKIANQNVDEEKVRGLLRNKIMKIKKYKAKIYDYDNGMFHLIIRADNKFIHGWVPAKKVPLEKSVEALSRYGREHINMKLEKLAPMKITSITQLEKLSGDQREHFLKALPRFDKFRESDAKIIKELLDQRMKEIGVDLGRKTTAGIITSQRMGHAFSKEKVIK